MRILRLIVLLVLGCPSFALAQGYVYLNEILADNANRNNLADEVNEFGNASDWVEIINPSLDDCDLYQMRLIKGNNPFTTNASSIFIFTNHVILHPNECLRVWCDKDGTNVTGVTDFHTGFALSKDGDTILLVDSDGATITDSVTWGLQLTDYALGRYPDGFGDWTLTVPTPGALNVAQPLADPMGLRINEWCPTNWNQWLEIIKNPSDPGAGDCGHCNADWVEIYNPSPYPAALALNANQALCLTVSPAPSNASNFWMYSFIDAYGFRRYWTDKHKDNKYDPDELNFKMSHNSGETIFLKHYDGRIIDTVTFPGQGIINWVVTNGPAGTVTNFTWYTQGRLPDGGTNIVQFPVVFTNRSITIEKSTPGDSNILPLTNGVYINELLAHTDPPLQDAVELINTTPFPVDISYYWLSNDRNKPQKYQIPAGTIIPPNGFKVIYEYSFNVGFTNGNYPLFTFNSAHGEDCTLYSGDSSGKLTGYRRVVTFDASANGVSFGRYTNSDGNVEFVSMSQPTFGSSITANSAPTWANSNAFVQGTGAPNSYPLVGPVVISEIMYHPPDIITNVLVNGAMTNVTKDNSLDEYVEIYNMSPNPVYLYDTESLPNGYTNRWRLHRLVDYEFSQDAALNPALRMMPGDFLLFVNFYPWASTNAAQLNHFRTIYNIPTTFTNIYGPYKGKLSNGGGTIELWRPDRRQEYPHYDAGYSPQLLVEQIAYNDKAPWPTEADGKGYSLQRRFPQGYGNDPTNWVSATPSPGRLPELKFESITRSNNTVTMGFMAWPFVNYVVERTSALSNKVQVSSWTTVSNLTAGTVFGVRQVTDTAPANETRFYRIRFQ